MWTLACESWFLTWMGVLSRCGSFYRMTQLSLPRCVFDAWPDLWMWHGITLRVVQPTHSVRLAVFAHTQASSTLVSLVFWVDETLLFALVINVMRIVKDAILEGSLTGWVRLVQFSQCLTLGLVDLYFASWLGILVVNHGSRSFVSFGFLSTEFGQIELNEIIDECLHFFLIFKDGSTYDVLVFKVF